MWKLIHDIIYSTTPQNKGTFLLIVTITFTTTLNIYIVHIFEVLYHECLVFV